MAIEKKMVDYLRKVSPGNPIRTVIDDIVRSGFGAMIVFETPELYSKKVFEGGFKINTKFSSQKLFELCKMDGAIIVSHDLKKILYANVLITPDNSIHSSETGTRHKAAERCAKQADTFVIAVSERRKKVSLYLDNSRHHLNSSEDLIRDILANLQVLEEQRESFNSLVGKLDILEISEMVSAIDVCRIIQKAELMERISEDLKTQIMEIGKDGKIINMRFRELTRNYDKIETEVLRDYSEYSLKKTKVLLSNCSIDDILSLEELSNLILQKSLDETVSPKGFRFLSKTEMDQKEISSLVKMYSNLPKILEIEDQEFEKIFKNKAANIKEDISNLREQILSGKGI